MVNNTLSYVFNHRTIDIELRKSVIPITADDLFKFKGEMLSENGRHRSDVYMAVERKRKHEQMGTFLNVLACDEDIIYFYILPR